MTHRQPDTDNDPRDTTPQVDAVVVGGGMAGLSAARAIAAAGTRVLLINGEDRLPYKRTKISKSLRAAYRRDEFALTSPAQLQVEHIELQADQVTGIDLGARTLTLATGAAISWRAMVLATGATPFHLFPHASHVIRSAADGDRINQLAGTAQRVAVIGGGVLGIEVADQLQQRGLTTALFSRDGRLMQREFTPDRSDWLGAICQQHHITTHLNTTVSHLDRHADGLTLHAHDAPPHHTDLVIECAGSQPNLELAEQAGVACRHGILVDETLATSHPGVFAAGDCVELWDGSVPHLWHQAEDQGAAAGQNVARYLGDLPPAAFANRPRRLKCEAFGEYIFSMNHHLRTEIDEELVQQSDGMHQHFGFEAGRLVMVVMTGDRDRAKRYEQAVWAGLNKADLLATLPIL